MKRILLTIALMSAASFAFGQAGSSGPSNSTFTFTPSPQSVGSNSSFQVTLSLHVSTTPTPVDGYDLWLATSSGSASLFSITSVTYSSPYTSFGNITTADPFNSTTDISSGYARNSNDLGNIATSAAADATNGQTVPLATLTISTGVLAPNTTYTFYTTLGGNPANGGIAVSNSHYSDVVDQSSNVFTVAQSSFSITTSAVPEPSSYLLAIAGIGLIGVATLRRRLNS